MPEDLEVGVLLQPKNDLEDEVGPVQAGGDGGDLSAAQQEQQEGTIAGGVSRGLAGAAIIGGILSQLKSVTGLLNAIFGFFSRALLPTIEVIAELIRPLVSSINDFIAAPGETVQQAGQNVGNFLTQDVDPNRAVLEFFGVDEENIKGSNRTGENEGVIDAIGGFLNFGGPESADQTGEAAKQKFKQAVDDAQKDKTGSFK